MCLTFPNGRNSIKKKEAFVDILPSSRLQQPLLTILEKNTHNLTFPKKSFTYMFLWLTSATLKCLALQEIIYIETSDESGHLTAICLQFPNVKYKVKCWQIAEIGSCLGCVHLLGWRVAVCGSTFGCPPSTSVCLETMPRFHSIKI